jgi:hypothetical protein
MGACILNRGTFVATLLPVIMGAANSTSTELFMTEWNNATHSLFGLDGATTLGPTNPTPYTIGEWSVSRTPADATHFTPYFNATSMGTSAAGTGTLVSVPNISVLAYDDTGTISKFSGDTVGLAAAGAGETAAQIIADRALFQAALAGMLIQSGC